jgi:dihydroxyacetone kinase DhaKLM complex PTS-EIIA-like component DhaM
MTNHSEFITEVVDALETFLRNKLPTSLQSRDIKYANHQDIMLQIGATTSGDEMSSVGLYTEPVTDLSNRILTARGFLYYVKQVINNHACDDGDDVASLDDETQELHKQFALGLVYFVQHGVDKIIAGNDNPASILTDIKLAASYYQTMCLLRQRLGDARAPGEIQGNVVGLLKSLLKYLDTISSTVGSANMQHITNTMAEDDGDIVSKLKAIFDEMSDVPSADELAKYVDIYSKLEMIQRVCKEILAKADKIPNAHLVEGGPFATCQSSGATCLQTTFALSKLASEIDDKVVATGDTGLDSLATYVSSVATHFVPRNPHPSKQNISELVNDPVMNAMYASGKVYYDLVDFYEQISGAVRVYLRTKDVVDGQPVNVRDDKDGGEYDDTNGIIKHYATNTISLDLDGTAHKFGPFYNVVKTGMANQQIVDENVINVENLVSIFKKAEASGTSQNMVLFTYGFSGSGKTFSLFGTPGDKNGIWEHMSKHMTQGGLTVHFAGYKKIYGYMSQKALNKANVQSKTYQSFDAFLNQELFVNGDTSDVEAFIKSTPNNKASSRGFLIMRFTVKNLVGKELGNIGLVDMAGNEDPYDLMVRLLPTLEWPSADQPNNFITNETSLVKSDFMYKALRNAYSSVLTTIFGECAFVFGKLNALGVSADSVKVKTRDSVVKRFKATYEAAGGEYSQGVPDTFTGFTRSVLSAHTKTFTAHIIKQLWTALKSETKFNLAETRENAFKDSKDVQYIFNGASTMFQPIDTIVTYANGKISLKLTAKQFDSLGNLMLVYHIIQNKIDTLYSTVSQANSKLDPHISTMYTALTEMLRQRDPLDFIKFDGKDAFNVSLQYRDSFADASWGNLQDRMRRMEGDYPAPFDGRKEYDAYVEKLLGLVDHITYYCFTVPNRGDVLDIIQLVALLRYKYNVLIKAMLENKASSNIPKNLDFSEQRTMFPPLLGDVDENLAACVFGTKSIELSRGISTQTVVDYLDGPRKYDVTGLVGVLEDGGKNRFDKKTMTDKVSYLMALSNFKDQFDAYLDDYFKSLRRSVIIDGRDVSFSQEYLLRIIQEGFFINQANVELISMLNVKKDGNMFQSRDDCTITDVPRLYFDKYNKFNNLYDASCSVTGLTQELNKYFDPDHTKYVMMCNVRREKDIKFRLGAIDTLRLVENLKST